MGEAGLRVVQLGTGDRVSAGEGQRRVARHNDVAACHAGVGLEVGELPFKITGIPEQHMVEKLGWKGQARVKLEGAVLYSDVRDLIQAVVLPDTQTRSSRARKCSLSLLDISAGS